MSSPNSSETPTRTSPGTPVEGGDKSKRRSGGCVPAIAKYGLAVAIAVGAVLEIGSLPMRYGHDLLDGRINVLNVPGYELRRLAYSFLELGWRVIAPITERDRICTVRTDGGVGARVHQYLNGPEGDGITDRDGNLIVLPDGTIVEPRGPSMFGLRQVDTRKGALKGTAVPMGQIDAYLNEAVISCQDRSKLPAEEPTQGPSSDTHPDFFAYQAAVALVTYSRSAL